MTDKPRQPKGIPVGGQYATTAKGTADDVRLGEPSAPDADVARGVLAAALERHGLDETLTGLDGRTITEAWDERFAILGEPEQPTTEQAIYDALGGINIGRHRGGPWLVWFDPNLGTMDEEDYDGNPTGQWEEVTAGNVDDPRGRVLAAQFHTRNGGGNRECWCSNEEKDSPDHGCTGQVVEDLQNRPDHLYDADADDDRTYADFYFRLPDAATDTLVESVHAEDHARAQRNAQVLLGNIESGQQGPWAVLEVNPDTEQARRVADEATREPFPVPSPHLARLLPPYRTAGPADDLKFVEGVVESVAAGDESPEPTTQWQRGVTFSSFVTAARNEQEAHQAASDLEDVLAQFRAGRLPDSVVRTLGGTSGIEREVDAARKRLMQAQTRLTARRHEVEEIREHLRNRTDVQARRDAAAEERDRLTWALRWPGPADTCPPQTVDVDPDDPW